MTFIADETSQHGNRPIEGFVITAGSTVIRLTNQSVGNQLDEVNDYTAAPGLRRSKIIRKGVGATGAEVEVRVARSVLASILPGHPQPFLITITRYQPTGSQLLFSGTIKNHALEENEWVLNCQGDVEARMTRRVPGMVAMPSCQRTFMDDWCRFPRNLVEEAADVVDVDGLTIELDGDGGNADGWFLRGEMHFNGERRTITSHVGNVFKVDLPFSTEPTGTVLIYPGCDKKITTCASVYFNKANFQGAPALPDQNIHLVGFAGLRDDE